MWGWHKKREGFEWHDYVRTTILVRRAKRRQKVEDVRAAAVHGLKDAGSAAAHGLHEAGGAAADGLRRAGKMGQAMGVSGAGAAARLGHRFWNGAKSAAAAISTIGATGLSAAATGTATLLAALLAPLLYRLADRRARIVVGAVGAAALFAVAYRVWAVGFDARAAFAALLALFTLGPALLAERHRDVVTQRIDASRDRRGAPSPAPAALSMRLVGPVIGWGTFAALVVFGLGSLINPNGPAPLPSTAAITTAASTPVPARPAATGDIQGRARAISGDTLRIARRIVRLDHIEAPERGQTCTRDNGKSWRCGEAARAALARLIGRARIICTISSGRSDAIARADCRKGDDDLAVALVRGGHVFAETGFFARHSGLEDEAREAKRGLWAGAAERPETFRAAAWEAAKEKAPDACPIKGRVASRAKLYVMPWMDGYDRIKIRSSRGERWFCSEEEARQAGWRPSGSS